MISALLRQASPPPVPTRAVTHKTRGRGHGPIVRLMSPSDLGVQLKPFVFLDLFETDLRGMAMPLHPHSGIATITVLTDGEARFDDPEAGQGVLGYGGVEWMRASGGVWHGKELSAWSSPSIRGFQLWIALPPELEGATPQSQYIEAGGTPTSGPAHVILGAYDGVASRLRAPAGITYLLVTLQPGEAWRYQPPEGQSVGWLALASGGLDVGEGGERLTNGDMAVLEPGEGAVEFRADDESGATLVIGSAVPHPHPLHLGYYSVHTSAQALAAGERRIVELKQQIDAAGDRRTASGSTPVYR